MKCAAKLLTVQYLEQAAALEAAMRCLKAFDSRF
jgi:hypothetical protein